MSTPEETKKFVMSLGYYFKEDNAARLLETERWINKQNVSMKNLGKLFDLVTDGEDWFPTKNKLKKYFQVPGEISGIQAYRIAYETARNCTTTSSVFFANNRISQTIKLGWGTWEAFGTDEQPDHFRQKQFIDYFETTIIDDVPGSGLLKGIYHVDGVRLISEGSNKKMIANAEKSLEGVIRLDKRIFARIANKETKKIGNDKNFGGFPGWDVIGDNLLK